jgi:hypothetical protein
MMNDNCDNKTLSTAGFGNAKEIGAVKSEAGKEISNIGLKKSPAQPILSANQVIIDKPFCLDIDVTNQTPIDEIPDSYKIGFMDRQRNQTKQLNSIKSGIENLSQNCDVENVILKEINLTVSAYDNHVIKTVFHAAVSAYASPLNLALKCESGSGKSYTTMETVKFLPPEDVLFIGSQSPKVISHERGIKKTSDGTPFEEIPEPKKPERCDEPDFSVFTQLMENWKTDIKKYRELEKSCYYEVDLRRKILVFLESVNHETFKMFKSTMSHDNPEGIDHKFVDDKGNVHITRLVGAPVMIFNSLDNAFLSEFATRTLTVTPNTTKEKIADAMRISNERSCFPWKYNNRLNKTVIQEYLRKVRDSLKAGNIATVNPFLGVAEIFSKTQTRDMRDFTKFLEMLPVYAMVKLYQRPIVILGKQRFLVPTVQDFLDAKAVFDSIAETTKTGTEQRIISFYWDCLADKTAGATAELLTELYNRERKHPLSIRRIREFLDRLVEIEWADPREGEQTTKDGYVDRQKITFHPLKTKNSGNNAFFQTAEDLKVKLEMAFDSWLRTCAEEIVSQPIMILAIDGTARQLNLEEFVQVVKGKEPVFTAQVSQPILEPIIENKQEDNAIQETATNMQTLMFRRLTPNEPRQCDGESRGGQCPHLAEYEMLSSDNPIKPCYCENHFKLTRINCAENGFRLVESKPNQFVEASHE